MLKIVDNLIKKVLLFMLEGYKKLISPILRSFFGHGCRYFPTCSEYSYQAIEKYGPVKGGKLALLRIMRCHPLTKIGYDPLPDSA